MVADEDRRPRPPPPSALPLLSTCTLSLPKQPPASPAGPRSSWATTVSLAVCAAPAVPCSCISRPPPPLLLPCCRFLRGPVSPSESRDLEQGGGRSGEAGRAGSATKQSDLRGTRRGAPEGLPNASCMSDVQAARERGKVSRRRAASRARQLPAGSPKVSHSSNLAAVIGGQAALRKRSDPAQHVLGPSDRR